MNRLDQNVYIIHFIIIIKLCVYARLRCVKRKKCSAEHGVQIMLSTKKCLGSVKYGLGRYIDTRTR
jgi:hypothetical protein